jgi:ABC-type sulfate/molybdate transport systems ATPase subunit
VTGERGVTLSGGQKARLSLARAVYQNKNVILLDDPLSAVDPHVAATIYTKCIRGILKSKTRILVTHNVECLRDCDRVVVMKNGAITAIGPPEDVLSLPDLAEEDNRPQLLERQASIRSFHSQTGNEDEDPQVAPLVEEEESMTGVVKWAVYVALFKAIGWPSVLGILILAFLNQGSSTKFCRMASG